MTIFKNGTNHKQDSARSDELSAPSSSHDSCKRCGGLMVIERFQDLKDQTGIIYFMGKRCVLCGEVIDQKIQYNRLHQNQVYPEKGTRTRMSAPQTMQIQSTKKGERS